MRPPEQTIDRVFAMIVTTTLAAALLLTLELARRGLEPACPACNGKSWTPHSTQLHCAECGWGKPE